MREFQERQRDARNIKRRIYSKTSLFILLCVVVLTGRGVLGVYAKERDSNKELQRLTEQKNALAARESAMNQNAERIKTPEGIEEEIRAKYDVAKVGEGVIVIVDKEMPVSEPEKKGIIQQFWDSVTGVFRKSATSSVANVPSAR